MDNRRHPVRVLAVIQTLRKMRLVASPLFWYTGRDSSEECLAAREGMLRIVKLLRSEVPAGVSGTLCFTAQQLHFFTYTNS